MSRLSDLYQAIDTLASEGLELSPEQENLLREAEEEIIQKEILPVLSERIEPVLSQIEREMVLVVDYVPGEPLKVSLSRERNIANVLKDAVEILPDPQVSHKTLGPQKTKKDAIAPRSRLRVIMPDGSKIERKMAKDTFVEAIRKIGIDRVRQLGLITCKVPLVSNTRDAKYGASQVPVEGGWLIITASSTNEKKKQLDKIAKALKLKIKVEVLPAL